MLNTLVTYDAIIPSDFIEELIVIRDSITQASFRTGDIVNQIKQARPDLEPNLVYSAVGSFVGKRSRTVREYAMVSAFYPMNIRREYETLSFDHFRTAMRYGDNWQDALEWAVNQTDVINRPATVDSMTEKFGEGTGETYSQEATEQIRNLVTKLKRLFTSLGLKEAVALIEQLENLIE